MALPHRRVLKALQPQKVWSFFETLSSIPRPSKHEELVLNWLRNFANKHGLRHTCDATGNVVIHRPGQHGGEKCAPIIIQGHVDMVTEKASTPELVDFDFKTDPIKLEIIERGAAVGCHAEGTGEDCWVRAQGTTLGADNGIGVAMALAILDDTSIPCPPLECLFTVDEETGLTGAFNLDATALELTGETLINLDTEDWGILYNGCAGGGNTRLHLPMEYLNDSLPDTSAERHILQVSGLRGGHSGVNIHEYRANAIKLGADAMMTILRRIEDLCLHDVTSMGSTPDSSFRLIDVRGGAMHNAIPRDCVIEFETPAKMSGAVHEVVNQFVSDFVNPSYGSFEKDLDLKITTAPENRRHPAFTFDTSIALLNLLSFITDGPIKFSQSCFDPAGNNLVETSNNLASVNISNDIGCGGQQNIVQAEIITSARSFFDSAVEKTNQDILRLATTFGAQAEIMDAYPAWTPVAESPILNLASKVMSEHIGRVPQVAAIHAGLECGVLMQQMPANRHLDAISFGPIIEEAHTPNERVHVPTVESCFEVLQGIVTGLVRQK